MVHQRDVLVHEYLFAPFRGIWVWLLDVLIYELKDVQFVRDFVHFCGADLLRQVLIRHFKPWFREYAPVLAPDFKERPVVRPDVSVVILMCGGPIVKIKLVNENVRV